MLPALTPNVTTAAATPMATATHERERMNLFMSFPL
jgi:hypothetical protein